LVLEKEFGFGGEKMPSQKIKKEEKMKFNKSILIVSIIVIVLLIGLVNKFTIVGFTLFEGEPEIICESYSDKVLFSSGYTSNIGGRTNYQNWTPKIKCSNLVKENCYLENIQIVSRYLYLPIDDEVIKEEGYVMISEPNENCNIPSKLKYSNVLFNKTWSKEITLNELMNKQYVLSNCYGIKIHTSQYSIIDVFEIKYKLCFTENEI
jgi:hypothetical protein